MKRLAVAVALLLACGREVAVDRRADVALYRASMEPALRLDPETQEAARVLFLTRGSVDATGEAGNGCVIDCRSATAEELAAAIERLEQAEAAAGTRP